MSPTSLTIDLRLKTVGRFKMRAGTRDTETHAALVSLLKTLDQRGRADLLLALRRRELRLLEVLEIYRLRGLGGLPTVQHGRALAAAVIDWLKGAELARKTRRDYRYSFDAILACAAANATLAGLPDALRRYRERAKGAVMFNRARAAARSFAGKHSDLWLELSRIAPKREAKVPGRVLTPDQAKEQASALGAYGGMFWTLCCTGMSGGPLGPYFQDAYDVLPDRIAIHGTKREGRERVVPRLTSPTRKRCEYQAFRHAVVDVGLTPNAGRHTFEHWLEMAIPIPAHRRRLMGHGPRNVTEAYGWDFPVEDYLPDYQQRLRAFIGKDWVVALEKMA